MNIFVTGGSGFIGQHLCHRLIESGHKVKTLVRNKKITRNLQLPGVEIVHGDLATMKEFDSLLKGCDVLFHVASILGPQGLSYKVFHDVNVTGTQNIILSAMRVNIPRIIHFSSVAVLGPGKKIPLKEDAPCNPGNAYETTKHKAEVWVSEQATRYPGITIVRPAWVYGPGDRRTYKLFKALLNGRFAFVGNGKGFQHPVYIDDLIDGTILAMEKPIKSGEIFHVAGPEIITIHELVSQVCKVLKVKVPRLNLPYFPMKFLGKICETLTGMVGMDPPISVAKVDFFVKNRSYSIEKARDLLGYNPKMAFQQGLVKTIDWYRKEKWL